MSNIEVKEKQTPRVQCPYCKSKMAVDLRPFQDDVTKIMESTCPYCNRVLYTAMTILTHRNVNGLMETLQAMYIAVNQVSRADASQQVIDAQVRKN
jgi:uncharacterized Zn-finger protein